MLATGPLLVTPVQFRRVCATVDRLRDETAPVITPRLLIKNIQLESKNRYYYAGNNDALITVSFIVNGGPPDEGVVITMNTDAGTVTKTQQRNTDITFTGLNQDSGVKIFTVADVALGAKWILSVDILNQAFIYNSIRYRIGSSILFPYVWFSSVSRLYINSIQRETPGRYYSTNNDAAATFTFSTTDTTADQGVVMTVDYNSTTVVTRTGARGTSMSFTGQDEHYGERLVTVNDIATNYFWRMRLDIVNGRVQYGNTFYYPGQFIPLSRICKEDNGLVQLTLTNVRTGFASLTCDGKVFRPITGSTFWGQYGRDLYGNSVGEYFGGSVSMSPAGDRIVVGSPLASVTGVNSGQAKVFSWNGTDWSQLGSNINGKAGGDYFGHSVSINGTGDRIAVGALYNQDNNREKAGQVRVFSWNGTAWNQLGADINALSAGDNFGFSVCLNATGNILATGARYGTDAAGGYVRIFSWNGSAWTQMGSTIQGQQQGSQAAHGASMNSAGDRIAIGAPFADSPGRDSGEVRVYSWNGSSWNQLGSTITGDAVEDLFGASVAMNSAGDRIVIGAFQNDAGGTNSGHTKVYTLVGNNWIQTGATIRGEFAQDRSGYNVTINAAGDRIGIGGYLNDGSGTDSGHTRIYGWNGSAWEQLGSDINGKFNGDWFGVATSMDSLGNKIAIGAPYNDGGKTDAGQVRVFSYQTNGRLKDQTFQITNLDGNRTTPYQLTIHVPHLNKYYSLQAFVGFKGSGLPTYPINSYLKYQNINYGEGTSICFK